MKTIAFQGELGAYSHEACLSARPNCKALPCKSFEEVISAVNSSVAVSYTHLTLPTKRIV